MRGYEGLRKGCGFTVIMSAVLHDEDQDEKTSCRGDGGTLCCLLFLDKTTRFS